MSDTPTPWALERARVIALGEGEDFQWARELLIAFALDAARVETIDEIEVLVRETLAARGIAWPTEDDIDFGGALDLALVRATAALTARNAELEPFLTFHKGKVEGLNAEIERLRDLVRHQRGPLHDAELITDAEYAALAADHGAVARLTGYDEMRTERDELRLTLAAEMGLPEGDPSEGWGVGVFPRERERVKTASGGWAIVRFDGGWEVHRNGRDAYMAGNQPTVSGGPGPKRSAMKAADLALTPKES